MLLLPPANLKEDESRSGSSASEEDEVVDKKVEEQNSWEEDSSSDSSNEEEEVEIDDSENEKQIKNEDNDSNTNQKDDSSSSSSSEEGSGGSDINSRQTKRWKGGEKKVWDENPDIYGIRRSNRARKETQRLEFANSDSDGSIKKSKRKQGRRKRNDSWIPTLSGSESEASDSSFDVPQKRNRKTSNRNALARRKQQRGCMLSTSLDEFGKSHHRSKKSQYTGVSNAKRTTISKVSYKEDTDDATDSDDIIEQDETTSNAPVEDVEAIEKVMRHRQGKPGFTGAQTTIYAVESGEEKISEESVSNSDETELQFNIKWKGWSHLHNTWESKETLINQKCAGMKKLENYIKRTDEIEAWKNISSPEDIEYYECQLEMNEDIQKHYQQVERIVAHQFTTESTSSYPDYLCKWQGLPYSDCTWEDGELTARFFQSHIDYYLERERSDMIPNRNAKCLRHRPKFATFKTQPEYIGSKDLHLRDYQLDGINWLAHAWCRETSVILADEMGLGKTIQTISFLSYLFNCHSLYGPFLVVVPLSTMDAWQREFQLWGACMNLIVYIGDVNSRTNIQEYEWCFKKVKKLKFNVVLTTYEMLLRDKELLGSLYWAVLVVDEAHRLKNEDSLLYRVLIEFRTNYRLLITGTPLQNSLKELWALMHFLMPAKFADWQEFESQYSISDKEDLQKLHRDLEPYLLRRVKKDVEKSLPAKVEQILRVEMSLVQKQYYKLILTKNVKELCKELKGSFSGLLNIIVELKKCCNHSNLIKPLDSVNPDPNLLETLIKGSGKMILLNKLLCRLKETGHRVLIFSQMVRMLDIIADYLYLKRFLFQRLDGSVRGAQRKRALDHFNAEGSQDFCFLLSTRAGGLGINLASADTVIIFDSDWNPQNDIQAMARAHRIGQKNQVNIYRFVTKNTIEEDIIERAKKKMVLDHLIIQRMDTTGRRILSKSKNAPSTNTPFNKEELSSILKFGAEDLFKDQDQDADQKLHAMDIDEILQRAETQESHGGVSAMGEELLSQFKVVNYAAFNEEEIKVEQPTPMQKLWEEIIPEEDRKRIEEEIENEKKAEPILKPRSRKTVEKMNTTHATTSKKVKSKAIVDTYSSSSSDSDEGADDEDSKGRKGPRKRGKGKPFVKEGVKGFSDNEIRRFVKSYKKFARPLTRLDSITENAELTDKSISELKELAALLKSSCGQAVKDYQEKLVQDEQFDGKKKGATVKISGVSINAPSVLKAEIDLEPLAACLPSEPKQQKSYRLIPSTRSVHWGVSWGVVEDSMLLVGMLIYGVGNWDTIKNDQGLGLSAKILPVGNGKPQGKHLQSRADYLLKLLKEQCNQHNRTEKTKPRTKRERKRTRDNDTPDKEHLKKSAPAAAEEEKPEKKKKTKKNEEKKEKKFKKKEEEKKLESVHPVEDSHHITVKDFRSMDDATFKKCKEKMRPEKKSLQLLHTPDDTAPQEHQVNTTKRCLLKIGDHIERCLQEFYDQPEELDLWRSNLWSFVAKFTELEPSKLFKLYRTACRKRDVQLDEHKKEIQKLKSNYTHSLHEIGKNVPPDRLELEEARKRALGIDLNSPATKIPKIDKMKIPHKKRDNTNNNKNYPYEPRDQQRDRNKQESWRDRQQRNDYGYHNSRDSRPGQQKPWKRSDINDGQYRGESIPLASSNNDNTSSGKQLTYREWKEAQKNKSTPPDEKPPIHRHSHKPYRDKTYHGDKTHGIEKPNFKQDQYPTYDPRSKLRYRDKPAYEQKEHSGGDYYHSPSYIKSPLSPHHEELWARKRTSSNNSDVSSNKKVFREQDHSSNSNQF